MLMLMPKEDVYVRIILRSSSKGPWQKSRGNRNVIIPDSVVGSHISARNHKLYERGLKLI